MRHVLTLFMFLGTIVALSSCSGTLDGVGKDIEKMGQGIQKSVDS